MSDIIYAINEATSQLKTIRDFVRFAVSVFTKNSLHYGHGTTNAYEEAVYIICHTLNLPIDLSPIELEIYLNATLLPSEIEQLLNVIKKRAIDKIPAPYITKQAICQGYEFFVDERVIIPRSFIAEIIVNDGLLTWVDHPELVHNVLDLCTGNGSIAIIAADHFYASNIVAADIDANALEVAKINVEKHESADKIKLIKSDLFKNLNKYKGKFDLILTNPPYVDSECMGLLTSEYKHEPHLALAGGNDGLLLIDTILREAVEYLTELGVLVVEMGDNVNELENKYPDTPFQWLETKSGEGFVFLLTKADLDQLNVAS